MCFFYELIVNQCRIPNNESKDKIRSHESESPTNQMSKDKILKKNYTKGFKKI